MSMVKLLGRSGGILETHTILADSRVMKAFWMVDEGC